jgi:hypothetical protein
MPFSISYVAIRDALHVSSPSSRSWTRVRRRQREPDRAERRSGVGPAATSDGTVSATAISVPPDSPSDGWGCVPFSLRFPFEGATAFCLRSSRTVFANQTVIRSALFLFGPLTRASIACPWRFRNLEASGGGNSQVGTVPMLCVSRPGFAPAHPPATLACQRFVNERARKDQDRLVPVRKWSYRWPAQIASGRSSQDQSGRPATHLKTVCPKEPVVKSLAHSSDLPPCSDPASQRHSSETSIEIGFSIVLRK